MNALFKAAHSTLDDAQQVVSDLVQQLGAPPEVVTLFFAPRHDGRALAAGLRQAWPGVTVVGCSTAGELSTGRLTMGGVSAAALGRDLVKRRAVALATFDGGVPSGMARAMAELEAALGQPLRSLDPRTHVGMMFVDSTHAVEEATHFELGNAAPLLSFVGGSAGDNLAFRDTRVLAGESQTNHGCALMVIEAARPFQVVKLCHLEPTGAHFQVTAAEGRKLLELDGRPAAEVYAEQVGVAVEALTVGKLAQHPAGLLIDGQPWVRQVIPPGRRGGTICLGCEVATGSTLHFLKRKSEIVAHFRSEMDALKATLGRIEGALLFDCALRRSEIDATHAAGAYAQAIDFPAAGFHTHGESWLSHMHQTLTAIAFG